MAKELLDITAIRREAVGLWRNITGMNFTTIVCEITDSKLHIGNKAVLFGAEDLCMTLDDFSTAYIEPLVRAVWEDTKAWFKEPMTNEQIAQRADELKKGSDQFLASVLEQRGKTHGSFQDNGYIAMDLRNRIRQTPNWQALSQSQQLALDEIMLKIARILSRGDGYKVAEHFNDIAGYGTLGSNACAEQK